MGGQCPGPFIAEGLTKVMVDGGDQGQVRWFRWRTVRMRGRSGGTKTASVAGGAPAENPRLTEVEVWDVELKPGPAKDERSPGRLDDEELDLLHLVP